jgi:hypothetical protein
MRFESDCSRCEKRERRPAHEFAALVFLWLLEHKPLDISTRRTGPYQINIGPIIRSNTGLVLQDLRHLRLESDAPPLNGRELLLVS